MNDPWKMTLCSKERPELEVPCRLWTGAVQSRGYGQLSAFGTHGTHRVAHIVFNRDGEPMDSSVQVLHRCDVKRCVEPKHLREGTHIDNMREARERGRFPTGEASPAKRPEVRAKIARALIGRPLTDEHKQSLSDALRGKNMGPKTEEHCSRISEGQRGKKRGPYKKRSVAQK